LDSFALIAYLEDELGAKKVEDILIQAEKQNAEAYLCVVNLGEMFYITYREQGKDKAEEALAVIDQLPIRQVDANRKLTLAAAGIKARYTVSYADAFVAALAQQLTAEVVTGDPEFQQLAGIVEILWLPSH